MQQCHSRLVGAQFSEIQQRVESEAGRITSIAALHHQQTLPITVPEAYLQVDTQQTAAESGQLMMIDVISGPR